MNNSKIIIDDMTLSLEEPVKNTEHLREEVSRLTRILEAIGAIENSEEWRTLKREIFDSTVENLEKRLKNESEKLQIDASELYRLQGQLFWARKYANLTKLSESYKLELSNIKKLII